MTATTPRGRRLDPLRPRTLLAALAVLALLNGLALAGTLAWPGRAPAAEAPASLPDTLLFLHYPAESATGPWDQELLALDPRTGRAGTLLAGVAAPTVAPDGRQLFFAEYRKDDAGRRLAVAAVASATLTRQWATEVAAEGATEAAPAWGLRTWLQAAVTEDRVYVVTHRAETAEPVTIVALDRADGRERARWTVDLEGHTVTSLALVAPPGSDRLYLLTDLDVQRSSPPEKFALFRFRLPDGQEEARRLPLTGPEIGSFLWGGRLIADGGALVSVGFARSGAGVSVQLLDLGSGAVESFELAFRPGEEFLPYEQALSHDGRRLFVLVPPTGELAIVDLAERRVEQVVPLDLGPAGAASAPGPLERAWLAFRELFVGTAAAKFLFVGEMQLSPDGTRLYAVGTRGQGHAAGPAGVWVIDTTTWRVIDRWLPEVAPHRIALSGDGRFLYVQQAPWGTGADAGVVRAIETASGVEAFVSAPLRRTELVPLADLYRERYGRSPAPGGVRPGGSPSFTTLAALGGSLSASWVAQGDAVTVTARFTVPRTGAPVQPGQPEVRYEPPARVLATLCRGVTCTVRDRTVALEEVGYGVYRAALPTSEAGVWSVEVAAEWPEGLRRRAFLPDALTVQRAFAGTDGRRYVLRVTTDPERPAVRQEANVRAAFVDAETGAPLAFGVTLADGLPEQVRAEFFSQAGFTGRELSAVGHGVYEGTVSLWSAERWRVAITFRLAGVSELASFVAGTLEVGP